MNKFLILLVLALQVVVPSKARGQNTPAAGRGAPALPALTRANDRITVVTTEPNRLVVGALVEIEPKNSLQFDETNSYLGGAIYIPPAAQPYVINSYLPVPKQVTIRQSGRVVLNETVSLAGSDNWFGDWSSQGAPQFAGYSGATLGVNAGSPGLYLMGQGAVSGG